MRNMLFAKNVLLGNGSDDVPCKVWIRWTVEHGISEIDFMGWMVPDYGVITLTYPSLQLLDMTDGISQGFVSSAQKYASCAIKSMEAIISFRGKNDKETYFWYVEQMKAMTDDEDTSDFVCEFGEWIQHHFGVSATGGPHYVIPFVERFVKHDYDLVKSMCDGMMAAGLQKCMSMEAALNLLDFFDGNPALCIQVVKPKACEATKERGLCEGTDWETCQHCPKADRPGGFYFQFSKLLSNMHWAGL